MELRDRRTGIPATSRLERVHCLRIWSKMVSLQGFEFWKRERFHRTTGLEPNQERGLSNEPGSLEGTRVEVGMHFEIFVKRHTDISGVALKIVENCPGGKLNATEGLKRRLNDAVSETRVFDRHRSFRFFS